MEYKKFEELKEELGDKFEEFMYNSNIELLTKIDKAIEILKLCDSKCSKEVIKILGDRE